jgi:protocatechuate 4,5-dioxygenase beta chain
MARLIGGVGASHVPSIHVALDRGLRGSPDWKPFFDGCVPCQEWAAQEKPDIAIVVFNDHGNAFFDKTPTFAIGCADRYMPIDEGYGVRDIPAFEGAPEFSWHIIDRLVESHFDPMICQELEVDHGLQVPMELLWGRPEKWPVKVVPLLVNVIQYPIPTPARCWELGKALRRAVDSYPGDEKIVVLGTGGLSHQLQGGRAGFINREADLRWLEDIASDPEKLRRMSRKDYVDMFGSEGAELIMWLVMRGALHETVDVIHRHYFAPASMTGVGMIVMEERPGLANHGRS